MPATPTANRDVIAMTCRTCGAPSGKTCRTETGHPTRPHAARVRAAARYAADMAAHNGSPQQGSWHLLGPVTRSVILQRRAGGLDPAAESPHVYALLLRAAVATDRANRDGWTPGAR